MSRKLIKPDSELTLEQIDTKLMQLATHYYTVEVIEAEMTEKIKAMREAAKNDIGPAQKTIKEIESEIKAFVESNVEMFKVKRTIELNHGKIGFRKSPGSLKLLPSWTWKKVVSAMEAVKGMAKYLIVKKDVDRNQLLGDLRNNLISTALSEKCGVSINDRDEVVIELKHERLANLAA